MSEKKDGQYGPAQFMTYVLASFIFLVFTPVLTAGMLTDSTNKRIEIQQLFYVTVLQSTLALIEFMGSMRCCISCAVIYEYSLRSCSWWKRMFAIVGSGTIFNAVNGLIVSSMTNYEVRKLALLNITGSIIHCSIFDVAMQVRSNHSESGIHEHNRDTKKDDSSHIEEIEIDPSLMF